MHQIINHFMINYKAFFRWLYSAIIHLMDEQMLPDMPKNTEQDVAHIMEFLLNFDNIKVQNVEPLKRTFTMERLGQYLEDGPLTILSDNDDNLWESFLLQNQCIQEHEGIIRKYRHYSLIQQFKHLVGAIEHIFTRPKSLIPEQFSIKRILNCLSFVEHPLRVTKINFSDEFTLITLLNKSAPADGIYFLEVSNHSFNVNGGYFYFKQTDSYQDNHHVLDIKFYSPLILSVLLQESNAARNGILYQFTTAAVRERLYRIDINKEIVKQNLPRINGMDLGCAMQKVIDGMVCSYFSVSGLRRVSIVLSENRKKVKLFEMEAEDDDEEDADMTNSARESDTSMQEEISIVE